MNKILLIILLFPIIGVSQKLGNLKAVPEGDRIIIFYDLEEAYTGDKFDISIYASHNNFVSPLQRVTGDAGTGIPPGNGRRIEWDAKSEIGNYKGEISFEIRAEVIGVFALTGKIISAKRSKTLPLTWRGGSKNQDVRIELLTGATGASTIGTVDNNGSFLWTVPAKQKTGSNFQLRLVNGKEMVTTESFSIKPKVPLIVKILPIAVIGAVVGLSGGSKSPSGAAATNLAMPPDLGLN